MIHAGEKNIKQAWRTSLRRLYDDGNEMPERDYYRVSPALIEVEDTQDEHYDDLYHLPVSDIAKGNRYLVTGEIDGEMDDEMARMYRERLFGASENEGGEAEENEEDGGDEEEEESQSQNQIDNIIEYLQENPFGKNALISLWQPEDMEAETPPPVQSLWFHVHLPDGTLALHVHAREADAYRSLLPDMSRFATLQHYVAERLGIPPGQYRYFVDTLHFRNDDREHVDLLLAP